MHDFWALVDIYTESRWWFGFPAILAALAALTLLVIALVRLSRRNTISVVLSVLSLSGAAALLAPGALLAWRPLPTLGIDAQQLVNLPTATYPAIAPIFDRALQMGYMGSGLLLVGMLSVLGALGSRRFSPCPTCGRERHPSWNGVCPECRLMEPSIAESPLMRLGDVSASGVPVTQFVPAQTELLNGAHNDGSWVEVIAGPSGVGERFAIGARLAIGRDPTQCRLVLDDETVSSRHAYIEREGQTFTIYDWGSRNGTYVHDELVARQTLRDGDLLRIGRVELRFSTDAYAVDNTPTVLVTVGASGAQLVGLNGAVDGEIFPLTRLDARIGRGRQNDIVLDSPTVSRYHASIRFDGSEYHLMDAGSPNGAWLDDTRVFGSAPLRSGQIIRLGSQQLRFEQEEMTDAPNC
jgi:pSer/pThr/pTyr-binding forkhead associated (FHA) protein